jgi:osmoprotectant transport system ATP-binding protein
VTAALRIDGVSKRWGSVVALDRVSLEIDAGACVALIGESGSGKTTLLRTINRMVEPDEGSVWFDGRVTATLDPVVLRRQMGYVPQEGGLLPHWRVRRNVGLVPWLLGQPAGPAADDALRLVGLDPGEFAGRWPSDLSGGQRQRVAIARALAAHPVVLLLDEPFGALDAITRAELQQAFRDLRLSLGATAVLVTHDLREAIELADRIAVLHHGRIEQYAPPAEVLDRPATPYVADLLSRAGVAPRRAAAT